ncbi:NIN-like protein [Artemisia annua]|uniref:NIN-like protein n=1 Tax=Artemisia annua TaxID=35608 RepID=A0A2U1PIQ7_ARTAN|nr:NIN-like protein [Artemisia annua]
MNSGTKVFDALKSRYPILSKPPADAGRLDNDGRYLTRLWVFGIRELDDDHDPQHSLLPDSFSKLMIDLNTIDPQKIQEKLISALSALSFRDQHVLVQFWSPATVRNRCVLTTWDQPFALGVVDDEGLYSYRMDSELRAFVVDREHREELGPPARVYSQKLPEWSFDIQTLPTRQFVQYLDASYNIHGYILLPVFEPDSERCVGVLELVISSNYVDFAFEVEEVSRALKEENLKSPNVSENIKGEPSDSGAVRTSHDVAPYSEKVIKDCDIKPETVQKKRKRKRSESSISLEEIKKHFGKSIKDAAAILNVSRYTLKHICRNYGIPEWPFRHDNDRLAGLMETSDLYRAAVKVNVLEDSLLLRSTATVSRLMKQIRTRQGIPNLPYGNDPDERLGTTNISTHGKHCTADDNWTIEATYRENC